MWLLLRLTSPIDERCLVLLPWIGLETQPLWISQREGPRGRIYIYIYIYICYTHVVNGYADLWEKKKKERNKVSLGYKAK